MVWIMSGKFPDGLDNVWKVSGWSGQCLESLQMAWKVSGSSGKLLAGLKVSVWSRKFLNSLEIV